MMLPLDIPPDFPVLPYEFYLEENRSCDWYHELLRSQETSSSAIGADKHFLKVMENTTKPWKENKLYIIFRDDQQLSIETLGGDIQQPQPITDDALKESITFIDRLNPIREQLGLTITQLAELFGVTRKSIYDWYDGIEPRSSTLTRLEILSNAIESISGEVDLKRLKVVWNIPISGKSFRDIYNTISPDDPALLEELVKKLKELTPNMAKRTGFPRKLHDQLGDTHTTEFDKHADFS